MYKCLNCGHLFSEGEVLIKREKHDDYYSEYVNVCPVCGSDNYEDCIYCRCCEDEHLKSELNIKGVCEECIENFIESNAHNENVCFDIGSKEKVPVEINSFILDYFGDVDNIERHLLEYIKGIQEIYRQDFSRYLKETDEDIISDFLLENRR